LLSQTDAAALRPIQQMDAEGESGAQWQDSGIAGLYVGYGATGVWYSRVICMLNVTQAACRSHGTGRSISPSVCDSCSDEVMTLIVESGIKAIEIGILEK
jgi:hypothetical protein